MTITFATFIFAFLFLFKNVQKNIFFIFYGASVIAASFYCENYLKWNLVPFSQTSIMLFVIFHIIFINIFTFIAYGRDKYCAKHELWRIPEVQLHTLELLGGIIGAVAGQKFFHHKNKKKTNMATFWASIIIQIGAILFISYRLGFF